MKVLKERHDNKRKKTDHIVTCCWCGSKILTNSEELVDDIVEGYKGYFCPVCDTYNSISPLGMFFTRLRYKLWRKRDND